MPYFHRNFFYSFGCNNKYLQSSPDVTKLTCPKDDITSEWENNVGIEYEK